MPGRDGRTTPRANTPRGDRRPETAPSRDRPQIARGTSGRSDRGLGRAPSEGGRSGGGYSMRSASNDGRGSNLGGSQTERRRAKSADGGSRGSRSDRGYGGQPRQSPGSGASFQPSARDVNPLSINAPPHNGGRLPNGRLLSGRTPGGAVHGPRCGQSRTQFGGIWEDHKSPNRDGAPVKNTSSGLSEFGGDEPTQPSTYQAHFKIDYDPSEGQFQKPNEIGIATIVRGVNGYGRSRHGGYFLREQLGEMKRYSHVDAFRAMPDWARGQPEPTRPGPGYTRTDQGGFFRT